MNEDLLLGPPSATLEILLDDPEEHDVAAPTRILSGLTPEQALATPCGTPHSIAQILAYMNANVKFNLGLIRAPDPLAYDETFENWPQVSKEAWPVLVEDFLAGLEDLKEIAREGTDLTRTLYSATADEASWSVGYKLACSVAKHNTYHLGQIVLLRRLLRAWSTET